MNALLCGLRETRRHLGRTTFTIATLAVTVGLAAAALGLVHGLFSRSWPVTDPDTLAFVFRRMSNGATGHGQLSDRTAGYDARTANPAVQDIAGFQSLYLTATIGGTAVRTTGEVVTGSYFRTLGIATPLGRVLTEEDDQPDADAAAVVISDRFWRARFGASADIIGETFQLQDSVVTIVGVAPPTFHGMSDAFERRDWWLAAGAFHRGMLGRVRPAGTLIRLRPGFTTTDAAHGFRPYEAHLRESPETPGFMRPPDGVPLFVVSPINHVDSPMTPAADPWRRQLTAALMSLTGLIVAMVVAGLGSLSLAAAHSRQAEVAVRRALGASSATLVVHILAAPVLTGVVGGGMAIWVATQVVRLITNVMPEGVMLPWTMSLPVLTLAVPLAVSVSALAQLAALRNGLRLDVPATLGTMAAGITARTRSWSQWLIVPVGFASLLVVVGATHLAALMNVEFEERGFIADGRTAIDVSFNNTSEFAGASRRAAMLEAVARLPEEIRSVTGLTATFVERHFMAGQAATAVAAVPAGAPESASRPVRSIWAAPDLIDTLGLRLVEGRGLRATDFTHTPDRTLISAALAQQLWPGQPAVGKQYTVGQSSTSGTLSAKGTFEVVGVVADLVPVVGPRPSLPVQWTMRTPQVNALLVVHGRVSPTQLDRISQLLRSRDPLLTAFSARPLASHIDDLLRPERIATIVVVVGALCGLMLAAVCVYAHVTLAVARRRQEIAIRCALGASHLRLLRDTVRPLLALGTIGVGIGIWAGALALPLAAHLVRGGPAQASPSGIASPAVVLALIVVATWWPLIRTARSASLRP
jgi:predicted permease